MVAKSFSCDEQIIRRFLIYVFPALLAVCSFIPALHAQGVGAAIQGTVRDTSGAIIPGAMITAINTETNLRRTGTSNESGLFSIPNLPPGKYRVQVSLSGFQTRVVENIELVVGQEFVLNTTLEVGGLAEQVTVASEIPLVDTSTAQVSGLVAEREVKDLPLNGRSFDNLISLNPVMVNSSAIKQTTSSSTGPGNYFSVAGRRPGENIFLWNGVEYPGCTNAISSTPGGVSGQLLGIEAVREFNIVPNMDAAEFGHRAGGQVSIVTQSGTNAFHGSAYEFLRNSALDARGFFDRKSRPTDPRIPPFRRNQFGGSLGGPIQKDKMFLFGNYEGFRQRWANSAATSVPDAFARQGMLPCYIATPAACPASSSLQAQSQYVTVPNLKPGMLPYLNYFWPTADRPIFDNLGRPTGGASSFVNARSRVDENFGMARFDYTISSKDSFWVNYNYDDGHAGRPPADPNFITNDRNRSVGMGMQETHIFSPTLLNTFTYGFAKVYALSQTTPAVFIPANLSFLSGATAGSITVGGASQTNAPGSVVAPNGNLPYRGRRFAQTWSDDVHYSKGNHSWSAGFWSYKAEEDLCGGARYTA